MPGMRTSMITTWGRRRSTRATAPAPSEASPITRTCGARESESRRPSRTTSWSSTIRQVISSGIAGEVYCAGRLSHAERELSGLRRRPQRRRAAVANAVRPRQAAHLLPHRVELRAGGDRRLSRRAPRSARAAPASRARAPRGSAPSSPARGRAGSPRSPSLPPSRAALTTAASCSGRSEMPGQDRRHADVRLDPGVDEQRERAQALPRRRRPGLRRPPDLLVERRHREGDGHGRPAGRLGEDVEVADDQRPAGDQAER